MAPAGDFGATLRRLRLAAGLTQEALAERAGLSAKALSDLERRPDRLPRLTTVALLADALRLEPADRQAFLAAGQPGGASPPGSGLPRVPTPLFGRDGVVAAVAEVVRRADGPGGSRLVTLAGPGGVGKTRVAVAVGERVADAFADGVRFVDLAPLTDPSLVLPAVARAVGVDDRDPQPLGERLTAALRHRHLLLLLDNLEHLLPARGEILALLEAVPRLSVLATSRAALQVRGEHCYRVAPLELPEAGAGPDGVAGAPAAALFLDRARAKGSAVTLTAETAGEVADICRRLDGLPLALELAATWTVLLPPAALLARMRPALPLLENGPADLPRRQRTLRDAIAWSYDLLDPAEQRLFRCLSVFSGGCTPEAAVEVCGDPAAALPAAAPSSAAAERATLLALATLADRSLVRLDPPDHPSGDPRLALLETLREFGQERLQEHGEQEAAARRHAAHFLALAEAQGGPLGTAAMAVERDNLRGALGRATERADGETSLRLAGAMWRFWNDGGQITEGRHWLRRALALPVGDDPGALGVRVRALVGAAWLAIAQGAEGDAVEPAAEATGLARRLGASPELVDALNLEGVLARERGDYGRARRHHDEALATARALADRPREATALTGLGYATTVGGETARGEALCEQGLTLLRQCGEPRALTDALLGLASTVSHRGAYDRATELAGEALGLARAAGHGGAEAEALWILGAAALMQGQHDRAAAWLEQDLALRRERGDERETNRPLAALALIALRHGEPDRARAMLLEALALLERHDDPWARGMVLAQLGHADVARSPGRAAERFAEAADWFARIGNLLYLPWCLEGFADVAAGRGAWADAARLDGARASLRDDLAFALPPAHPERHAGTMARCRRALGEAAFAEAHAAGRALSASEAVALGRRAAELP